MSTMTAAELERVVDTWQSRHDTRYRDWTYDTFRWSLVNLASDVAQSFAASELRRAQQPGEVPEGLEAAERLLRAGGPHGSVRLETSERSIIAAELDRLRATNKLQETELAALRGEAERTVFVVAEDHVEAMREYMANHVYRDVMLAARASHGERIYYFSSIGTDIKFGPTKRAATLVPSKETP
jgi:hypothetical protein